MNNTKICRYCGGEFCKIDFPAQFERMITCGRTECMRQRRWERLGYVEKIKELKFLILN